MAENRAARVGGRVRKIREGRGVTQEVLAVRAGVGVATIRRLEKGEHDPRVGTVAKVAVALEVPVTELEGKAS